MAIRYKITLVVATSMAAILSINHSYLTVTHLFGVNDKLSFSFDLIIIPISILLICGLIYFVVGIYTDRLKVVKNSFKNIQENEVVTFPIKMKDEIGDMMFELEEVSKRMLEQVREVKMFQEERLLIANTDSLTGLPNRDNFLRKLDGREDRKNGAVLVSVVLKDILKLNALRGSDISNQVILLIVKRLQSFSTYPIILGRMSTNHFSIYYESTERINWNQLEGILVETLQKLSAPVEIDGEQLFLKVQMGISLRNSNEKTSLLNLVQLADLAVMEESGSISQNIYLSHDLLQEEHAYKQKLEVALRQSIASRDFQVVYQPIVGLHKSKISLETLVRWKYIDEWISPIVFIPILEDIGLIDQLTKQVIDMVVNDWWAWKIKIPDLSHISLNISPKIFEFGGTDILSYLTSSLLDNSMLPSDICLEITENVILDTYTVDFIDKSRQIGFMIAVDDFGTGYSSMSYIAKYQFDVIKLDREFVIKLETNYKKREVAQAIVHLSKRLGIKVVAEGVETEEQLRILREMGTDEVQGYYFSKPQFLKEWDSLILDKKRRLHTNVY